MLARRLTKPNQKSGAAGTLARLTALDHWLDDQEKQEIPQDVHALLTHLIDETSIACVDLQNGLEGDAPALPRQPEAAQ